MIHGTDHLFRFYPFIKLLRCHVSQPYRFLPEGGTVFGAALAISAAL